MLEDWTVSSTLDWGEGVSWPLAVGLSLMLQEGVCGGSYDAVRTLIVTPDCVVSRVVVTMGWVDFTVFVGGGIHNEHE